ncbi:MAG: hypothetical protein H8E66_17110 [Planctomycetes bacterium]|nr:hypothetical protein [Planctomycetota bacterium]
MSMPKDDSCERGDAPVVEDEIHSSVTKGAKSTTVFGALFGAAAAVPT